MKTVTGWHFTGETLRDGQPIPPVGKWLKLPDNVPIIPCRSGLHCGVTPWDSLNYARGAVLHYVELRGELQKHKQDKWVGRERRILQTVDATLLLRRFAADQALTVTHLWPMPTVVKTYLETLDENLRSAAQTAAQDAAWTAARAAARKDFDNRVYAAFKSTLDSL